MKPDMKPVSSFSSWVLWGLLALAGCSQVPPLPDAHTPSVERFREAPADRSATGLADAAQRSRLAVDWWSGMNDPVLNQLQNQLALGSPSLQVLAAQTRQAQAALVGAQASLWPSLNLDRKSTRLNSSH